MPSSTSSFERRIPGGAWRGAWLLALALLLFGVAVTERALRSRGHRPSVVDDETWWAVHRRQLDDSSRTTVAVLGSSRMQLGFDAAAFAAAAPGYRAVQLAIDGSSPLGTLRDLAADPSFRGVVLCDLAEWEFGSESWSSQAAYVARYHELWRAPGQLANRALAVQVQRHLAVLAVGGRQFLAAALGQRRLPEPSWVATAPDRTRRGDYSLATPEALAKRIEKNRTRLPAHGSELDRWQQQAAQLEPWVRAIRSRGGNVVLVRMPTAGQHWERAETMFPKARYWDSLAARSGAITVHFQEVPALRDLALPDEIHLDQRAAATFTAGLIAAVQARGALLPP